MRHLRLHFHLHPLSTLLLLSSDPHRAATFTSYSRPGERDTSYSPTASLPGFAFSFIPLPPSLSLAHELKREESATVAAPSARRTKRAAAAAPKLPFLSSLHHPRSLSLSLSPLSLISELMPPKDETPPLPPSSVPDSSSSTSSPPPSFLCGHTPAGGARNRREEEEEEEGGERGGSFSGIIWGREEREGGREGT